MVTNKALMGIDYGTKRVGVALSPSGSGLAFPEIVLTQDNQLIDKLVQLITENQVSTIVIGQSKNLDGTDNPLQKDIMVFLEKLKFKCSEVAVDLEPEHYTSFEAERWMGKHDQIDASAAAIILQAWIDRQNKMAS